MPLANGGSLTSCVTTRQKQSSMPKNCGNTLDTRRTASLVRFSVTRILVIFVVSNPSETTLQISMRHQFDLSLRWMAVSISRKRDSTMRPLQEAIFWNNRAFVCFALQMANSKRRRFPSVCEAVGRAIADIRAGRAWRRRIVGMCTDVRASDELEALWTLVRF